MYTKNNVHFFLEMWNKFSVTMDSLTPLLTGDRTRLIVLGSKPIDFVVVVVAVSLQLKSKIVV